MPATASASEIGPAPTASSIATDGPFEVAAQDVPRPAGWGFGDATVYSPARPNPGEECPTIVITPGFTGTKQHFAHYGQRLASHGYVVMVINTVTLSDNPASRGKQAGAAMNFLKEYEPTSGIIDPSRSVLIGHSMGGGGSLDAAKAGEYSAVVALNPWEQNRDMSGVTEPTLIVGSSEDTIAPESVYQDPMYDSLGAVKKAYYNRIGGDHLTVYTDDAPILSRVLAFVKYEVDGDTRYRPFICAPDDADGSMKSTIC